MRVLFLSLFSFFIFISLPSYAAMQDYPVVKLQALDKSTARTKTFEVKVGSTIEYGSLFIKVQACRKSEPLDQPESAAFLQVWEVPVNAEKSEWVFSGWMFASSPALSAMDHAVYDVWVLDCIDNTKAETPSSKVDEDIVDQDKLETIEESSDVEKTTTKNEVIEDSEAQVEEISPDQGNAKTVTSPSKSAQDIENTIENVIEDAVNLE